MITTTVVIVTVRNGVEMIIVAVIVAMTIVAIHPAIVTVIITAIFVTAIIGAAGRIIITTIVVVVTVTITIIRIGIIGIEIKRDLHNLCHFQCSGALMGIIIGIGMMAHHGLGIGFRGRGKGMVV